MPKGLEATSLAVGFFVSPSVPFCFQIRPCSLPLRVAISYND